MSRNILLCSAGIILGFIVGFFVANAVSRPAAPVAASRTGDAGSLTPSDVSDNNLPPNHPNIGDNGTSAAANSPEAQAAMEKADRSPEDFDAQMSAAKVFSRFENYDKAVLYLNRAVVLKPKDFDALKAMGDTKYDSGDFNAAAAFYERALAVKADDPNVRTDFGNTFFRRTPPDFERSIIEYRKSVAIDPNHETSWKNIAAAALNLKDKAVASEAVERLAAINPQAPELQDYRQKLAALP